jgi:acyl-CoA reductase-like NAD-dependent aldehyde dehydrogenase
MNRTLKIISPIDGSVYEERPLADDKAVRATLERGRSAQLHWREVPLAERLKIATAFTDAMVADKPRVTELLAWQMGRPVRYGPGEMRGFEERARYMIRIAPEMLADIDVGPKPNFTLVPASPAARCRAQPAGVELPVHDGAQRRAARDHRRELGRDEAFIADGAGRRAHRRDVQKGESAEGCFPGSEHVA